MDIIFGIVVLIFSVILHEVVHGYMANWLGDPTARLSGRLTLNPISHVDPIGTILLPAMLVLSHSPVLIGYAKPVPYNPYNLPGRWDEALVAGAGPATNLILALAFGLSVRLLGPASSLTLPFLSIALLNLLLAIFNLIPIPPLDGSKVLSSLLPGALGRMYGEFRYAFERLGILSGTLVLMIIFVFISRYLSIALFYLLALISGVSV